MRSCGQRGRPMRTPPRSRKQDAVTQLDKRLRASAAIRDEWEEAAYAQYLLADAECRGNLFSAAGKAARGADEFSLWSARGAADAKRFARRN